MNSRITRRSFLTLLAGSVGGSWLARQCLGASQEPQTAARVRKTNVLFIAVDDLRPQLGCYGHKYIKSPNIDRLASGGLTFDAAYCQQAVCAPSRASILSGTRPDTTKIYDLETPLRTAMPEVRTLPEHFKLNGYETVSIGKIYHHGNDDMRGWSVPPYHAKGAWKGRGYVLPESIAQIQPGKPGQKYSAGLGPAFESADVPDSAYPDGADADRAIAELQRLKDKPFFLAVGFHKPHLPFCAPKKYWDLYKPDDIRLAPNPNAPENAPSYALTNFAELRSYAGMPAKGPIPDDLARKLIHGYYACVSYTDAQIGRLLDELDRLGIREHTVVILWGDHGWKLGEHGCWCKHTNFEMDTHVPLILSVPGTKTAGRRSSALVEFVDMYPTLCQACGLSVPGHLEGLGMMPLVESPDRPWKAAAFSQYPRGNIMGYTMRTRDFRYTEWKDRKTGKAAARELYDHRSDPQENKNLADKPDCAADQKRLAQMLSAGWLAVRRDVTV